MAYTLAHKQQHPIQISAPPCWVTLSIGLFRVAYSWSLYASMTTSTKPEVIWDKRIATPEDDRATAIGNLHTKFTRGGSNQQLETTTLENVMPYITLSQQVWLWVQLPTYASRLKTWHCPHSPAVRRSCSNRSTSPDRRPHSKPAAAGLLLRAWGSCWNRQTDGDHIPFHGPAGSACYAGSVSKQHC